MRALVILGWACLITACGSGNTNQPETDTADVSKTATQKKSTRSKGHVIITAKKMETESQANGLITHCHITFYIDNRTDHRVKRLTMAYKPETSNEFDEIVHAAAGEQSLYFRDVPKGKSSKTERVMGLECEGLTTLNIFEQACSTEDGPCAPETVKISGANVLTINTP